MSFGEPHSVPSSRYQAFDVEPRDLLFDAFNYRLERLGRSLGAHGVTLLDAGLDHRLCSVATLHPGG